MRRFFASSSNFFLFFFTSCCFDCFHNSCFFFLVRSFYIWTAVIQIENGVIENNIFKNKIVSLNSFCLRFKWSKLKMKLGRWKWNWRKAKATQSSWDMCIFFLASMCACTSDTFDLNIFIMIFVFVVSFFHRFICEWSKCNHKMCSKQIICKQNIIKSEIETRRNRSQCMMILKSLFFTSMNILTHLPNSFASRTFRRFFLFVDFSHSRCMICLSAFISVIFRLPLSHSMCFCVTSDLAFMT